MTVYNSHGHKFCVNMQKLLTNTWFEIDKRMLRKYDMDNPTIPQKVHILRHGAAEKWDAPALREASLLKEAGEHDK